MRKLCLKCGKEKELEEMVPMLSCKEGREHRCKECKRAASRAYHYTLSKAKLLFNAARHRAKRDGLEFDIAVEDIVIPKVCPVLLTPMFRPSLDRKNPKGGYTRNNTRVISYRANMLKNDATVKEMELVLNDLRTCELI